MNLMNIDYITKRKKEKTPNLIKKLSNLNIIKKNKYRYKER